MLKKSGEYYIIIKMSDAMRYIRWKDALTHYKNLLNEVTVEAKTVNSSYQKYLKDNPYKEKKNKLEKKKREYTKKILDLVEEGDQNYKGA